MAVISGRAVACQLVLMFRMSATAVIAVLSHQRLQCEGQRSQLRKSDRMAACYFKLWPEPTHCGQSSHYKADIHDGFTNPKKRILTNPV